MHRWKVLTGAVLALVIALPLANPNFKVWNNGSGYSAYHEWSSPNDTSGRGIKDGWRAGSQSLFDVYAAALLAARSDLKRALFPPANALTPGLRAIFGNSATKPNVDLNFATGAYTGCTLATCLVLTRASSKTDLLPVSASGAQFNVFGSNVLAITPGAGLGLRSESARTNQLINSCNATTYPTQCAGNTGPANQTTPVLTATPSTLWMNGSGSVALSNGSATGCVGTALQGAPVNFTPTVGTCVVTVSGSINAMQLEAGANGTSFIITGAAPATRAADSIALAGLAKADMQAASFFAVIYTNLMTGSNGILEAIADDILRLTSNTAVKSTFGSTTLTTNIGSGNYSTGLVKTAIGVSPGTRSLVANNGVLVSDSATISVDSSFFIGSAGSGVIVCDCWIPRVQFGLPQPPNTGLSGLTR